MAIKDAVATVLNRNAYYRDGYRMLLRISIIQGIVILLLIAGLVGLIMSIQTREVYFATTSDGRIIDIVPINMAYRSRAEVVDWARTTAQNVMRFDYSDYRERLQQSSSNFTPTGWDSFSKALKDSNVIDAITARKLVVKMEVTAAPEVKSEGAKNGVYTWYLQVPVTIRYDGVEAPPAISATLLLQVVRVSNLQNPEGISIEQWVVKNPTIGR